MLLMPCTGCESLEAGAARREAAATLVMVAVHEQARGAQLFRLVDDDQALPVSFGHTWRKADIRHGRPAACF